MAFPSFSSTMSHCGWQMWLLLLLLVVIPHHDNAAMALASSSSSAAGGSSSSSSSSNKNKDAPSIISLQDPYGRGTPAQVFQEMADYLQEQETTNHQAVDWDVYGDFGLYPGSSTESYSFLRQFEAEMAEEMGMADAVFMPSGVMAQSIALLIHQERKRGKRQGGKQKQGKEEAQQQQQEPPSSFICHESSHLILHEEEGYQELLHLQPIVVSTTTTQPNQVNHVDENSISIPPMTLADIQQTLAQQAQTTETLDTTSTAMDSDHIAALLLELPHRELGGKLNSIAQLVEMRDFCRQHDIAFHIDGARIFEASTGLLTADTHNDDDDNHPTTLAQLLTNVIQPDSLYVSCYKGLGGLAGAFLLGDDAFCQDARTWLRRFGGNLYTLLPYAVAARRGYEREWKVPQQREGQEQQSTLASFGEKKQKLANIVQRLSQEPEIRPWLAFDPAVPHVNMIHGYLRHCSVGECEQASRHVQTTRGVQVVRRFRAATQNPQAVARGYNVMFEWTMGQANYQIDNDLCVSSWREFCRELERIVAARTEAKEGTTE